MLYVNCRGASICVQIYTTTFVVPDYEQAHPVYSGRLYLTTKRLTPRTLVGCT